MNDELVFESRTAHRFALTSVSGKGRAGVPSFREKFFQKKIPPLPPGKNGLVGVAAANASTAIRPRLVSVFRRLVS